MYCWLVNTCVDTLTIHLCSIKSSLRSTSLMGLIIPGPSHFSKLEAVESWAEPRNEATDTKIYRRSGNFRVVKFSRFITLCKDNFVFYLCKNNFWWSRIPLIMLHSLYAGGPQYCIDYTLSGLVRVHMPRKHGVQIACWVCGYHAGVGKLLACEREPRNVPDTYCSSKDIWSSYQTLRKLSHFSHKSPACIKE